MSTFISLFIYPYEHTYMAQLLNNPPEMWETWVWSLGWEDPLEKGRATHSSILAWRIPWTVQSVGLQRVRHDWVTFHFTPHTYTQMHKIRTKQKHAFTLILVNLIKYLWVHSSFSTPISCIICNLSNSKKKTKNKKQKPSSQYLSYTYFLIYHKHKVFSGLVTYSPVRNKLPV